MKNMDNKNVIKTTENQAAGVFIATLNQIRADHLNQDLFRVEADFKEACAELNEGWDSIRKVITTNRGGETGMHGFIGERAQVFISNAKKAIVAA